MTDAQTDRLNYSFVDGWCRITVIRDTSDIREGGNLEVHRCDAENFPRALIRLIEYHGECVEAYSRVEDIVLQGASCAESGVMVDRRLRPWAYDEKSVLLVSEDKGLLRGIVSMHNEVVGAYQSKRRILI